MVVRTIVDTVMMGNTGAYELLSSPPLVALKLLAMPYSYIFFTGITFLPMELNHCFRKSSLVASCR